MKNYRAFAMLVCMLFVFTLSACKKECTIYCNEIGGDGYHNTTFTNTSKSQCDDLAADELNRAGYTCTYDWGE